VERIPATKDLGEVEEAEEVEEEEYEVSEEAENVGSGKEGVGEA